MGAGIGSLVAPAKAGRRGGALHLAALLPKYQALHDLGNPRDNPCLSFVLTSAGPDVNVGVRAGHIKESTGRYSFDGGLLRPHAVVVGAGMTRLRNPGNLFGGLALIALALFTFWQISDLEVGRAMRMGPGYFPRLLAILIGAMGVLLVAMSAFVPGPRLERWSLGRLGLVLGSIVVFAITIRPLGLVLSGAILIVLSTLAAPGTRWKETAIFGVALLVFVTLLFPIALSLPLAIWPRF